MTAAIAITAILQQTRESFTDKLPGFLVEWKMVAIPEGKVTVGGKEHQIKAIWIGETEVTWDLYDVFAYRMDLTPEQNAQDFDAENRPSRPYGAPDRGFGHSGFAALSMAHPAAVKFCEWLSKKTGKKYRLPTEVEWEYAARAGAASEPSPIGDYAWHEANSDFAAHKVKSKKPNAWGLYDTLGNAAEWCSPLGVRGRGSDSPSFVVGPARAFQSATAPDLRAAVQAPATEEPVVRGGSFYTPAADLKFSLREPYDPAWQLRDAQIPKSTWWFSDGEHIGLRLVCEP